MKGVITFMLVMFTGLALQAQEFKFKKESIDYGKVVQGSDGNRVFEFTNIGSEPIVIKRVASTCGCAVPKKPTKPVLPGETASIEVSYNTNKVGRFSKAITILSNAKNERKVIRIKGVVVPNAVAITNVD